MGTAKPGIEINGSPINGAIVNDGVIQGGADDGAIYLRNQDTVIAGGIRNSGTIVGGTGLYIENDAVVSNGIRNTVTGIMTGTSYAGLYVGDATVTDGILNEGAIEGPDYGMATDNTATLNGDLLNAQAQASSAFAAGGPTFVTRGLNPSPWLIRLGAGLITNPNPASEFMLRYDAEAKPSGYRNHTLSVRWRKLF